MSTTRILVFGDPHIKPIETSVDLSRISIPDDIDLVVSLGDVIHDARDDAIEYGRDFFERVASFDRPVVAVPGNHDPLEHYSDIIGGLDNVRNAHDRVLTPSDSRDSATSSRTEIQFVGWGCEQFDQEPELRPAEFPELIPENSPGQRRYIADQVAQRIEDELYAYLTGGRDIHSLAETLEIKPSNRPAFQEQVDETAAVFDHLSELIKTAAGETVVLSHVPPYNTESDRHHSIGDRDNDIEGLHVGSSGLKLALRAHGPVAALHGHSHNPTYECLDGSQVVHSLNLGFQGIATVTIETNPAGFSFNRLTVDE